MAVNWNPELGPWHNLFNSVIFRNSPMLWLVDKIKTADIKTHQDRAFWGRLYQRGWDLEENIAHIYISENTKYNYVSTYIFTYLNLKAAPPKHLLNILQQLFPCTLLVGIIRIICNVKINHQFNQSSFILRKIFLPPVLIITFLNLSWRMEWATWMVTLNFFSR